MYLKSESGKLGFTVCVDCWVPKLLAGSNKVDCDRNGRRIVLGLDLRSEGGIRVSGSSAESAAENGVYDNKMENRLDLELRSEGQIGALGRDGKSTVQNRVYKKKMKNGLNLKLHSEGEIRVSGNGVKSTIGNGIYKNMVNKNGYDLKMGSECECRGSVSGEKIEAERTDVVATKAKEKAMRKVVLAERALEFANGALAVAKKKGESEKNECSVACDDSGADDGGCVVFDDAKLAIRLHRAMNSSPRISRRFSLGNPNGLAVQCVGLDKGDSSVRSSKLNGELSFTYKRRGSSKPRCFGPTDVCIDSKVSEKDDTSHSESSVCRTPSEEGDVNNELLVYKRKCKNCDEHKEKGEVIPKNDSMVFGNQICRTQDMLVYRRKCKKCNEFRVKEEVIPENSMGFQDQVCHTQDVLVYRRKCKREDEDLIISEEIPEDSMNIESQSCHMQYELVYKNFSECQVEAEVIPENSRGFENQVCQTRGVLVYKRKCKKEDEYQGNGLGIPEDGMGFERRSCHTRDELDCKLCVDGNNSQCHSECNGICNENFGSLASSDRYVLKYRKRSAGSKEPTNSGRMILLDGPCTESSTEATGLSRESAGVVHKVRSIGVPWLAR